MFSYPGNIKLKVSGYFAPSS